MIVVVVLMLMVQGQTALHLAVQQGNLDVIGLLAEKGANVDSLDQVCFQPLFFVFTLLVSKFGYNPLMRACEEGRLDAVKELIKLGVPVGREEPEGFNARFVAAHNNKFEILAFLEGLNGEEKEED